MTRVLTDKGFRVHSGGKERMTDEGSKGGKLNNTGAATVTQWCTKGMEKPLSC